MCAHAHGVFLARGMVCLPHGWHLDPTHTGSCRRAAKQTSCWTHRHSWEGSPQLAVCRVAAVCRVVLCALLLQFHERVQLDSITHNELGDPDVLAHVPAYAPGAAAGPIGEHWQPRALLSGACLIFKPGWHVRVCITWQRTRACAEGAYGGCCS
jgi:hypothetical protein